jgi:hypothetical protein
MRLRHLYPLAALAFSGCNLVAGKCSYEIRSTDAQGQVSGSVTAQVTLSEQRGSLQGQSFQWLVTSEGLKGHVTSASFKDSSNPGQVLLDLPLSSADRPEITTGGVSTNSGANLAGFRDIIVAGHGVVEMQTDLSSQPITIQLTPTTIGDWIRPYCS